MGGTCGTYGGEMYTGIRWGNRVERGYLEDLSVDGRIIFKWLFKKWHRGHGLFWYGSG